MNKKIIFSGSVAILFIFLSVGLQLHWPKISIVLKRTSTFFSPQASPISVVDNSQNIDISVDLTTLTKIYNANVTFADQSTKEAFEPIIIELTDQRQANAYFWGKDEMYESIAVIKTVPTGKKVMISVNPAYMEKYGWSKRTIEQELEVLLVQGVITQPSLTLTATQIEANKAKAATILEALNYQQFVTQQ
jgi:hypothetical protein